MCLCQWYMCYLIPVHTCCLWGLLEKQKSFRNDLIAMALCCLLLQSKLARCEPVNLISLPAVPCFLWTGHWFDICLEQLAACCCNALGAHRCEQCSALAALVREQTAGCAGWIPPLPSAQWSVECATFCVLKIPKHWDQSLYSAIPLLCRTRQAASWF